MKKTLLIVLCISLVLVSQVLAEARIEANLAQEEYTEGEYGVFTLTVWNLGDESIRGISTSSKELFMKDQNTPDGWNGFHGNHWIIWNNQQANKKLGPGESMTLTFVAELDRVSELTEQSLMVAAYDSSDRRATFPTRFFTRVR